MRVQVADLLGLYRRSPTEPSWSQLVDALSPDGSLDAAAIIALDAEARRALGRPCDPERWWPHLPRGPGRASALDAIVAAVIEDEPDDDRQTDACRTLAARGVDAAAAVARVRLVREVMRQSLEQAAAPAAREGAPPDPPCDFGPPLHEQVPRFRLLRRLGAGSSGVAYEALDRRLGEADYEHRVVVKVLPAAMARRAEEELRRGSRVRHEGVVRWLDWGVAPCGSAYVVSELVPSKSLDDPETLRRLGRRGAVDAIRRAAEAIDATHAAGLVHLDLKPANILIDHQGAARLCDFGAAMPIHGASASAASTPMFAAPEVLQGLPPAPAADVYALGAVLRWCMDALDELGVDPLEERAAARLEQIWRHAMDPSPDRRYSPARTLARDLAAWLDERPLSIEPPSLLESVRLSMRRDPLTWLLAAAALLAVSLLAWSWADQRIEAAERRSERLLQESRRLRAQAELSRYIDRLELLAQRDGASAAPQALALQWLVSARGIDAPKLQSRAMEAQRLAWRSIVDRAEREGAMDHLEPRLAELSLAVAELREGRYAETHARLSSARAWWDRFDPQDPMVEIVAALTEIAGIGAQPPVSPAEVRATRARLAAIADAMRSRAPQLARLAEETSLRLDPRSAR